MQHIDRRSETRQARAEKVRFEVNGGPAHTSDTLNFTRKSIAIRSRVPVKKGDKVRVTIETLPPFEGFVVRHWDEGFAIRLTDEARAIADDIRPNEASMKLGRSDIADCARLVPVNASGPCWFGICRRSGRKERCSLLVAASHSFVADNIQSVWISIGDMRTVARVLGIKSDDQESLLLLRIDDLQLQYARKHGLAVTVLSPRLEEWCASASPGAVEELLFADESWETSAA